MERDVIGTLSDSELFWRNKQEFLQSHGYMLRPRYRVGWIPSWKLDPTAHLLDAEDRLFFMVRRAHVMDARRISDNKLVLIKKVAANSQELQIGTYFSSIDLRQDPRNHCVPILDVLTDVEDTTVVYIVMPFLRHIASPDFDTVGSILTCVQQLLEGLVFLHEHNVAHRDCAYMNVMMDADAMYPRRFHPIAIYSLPDAVSTTAPVLPRESVPVTYYYVDFGISAIFSAPEDITRRVTGIDGQDQEVPELSDVVPYDPFKVDIFILGNLFRRRLLERYSNVGMLSPLVSNMIRQNPDERPNAIEALEQFSEIARGCGLCIDSGEQGSVASPWKPYRSMTLYIL
ncbi:hypothetical protein C8Q80DRAFT_559546 [Daedaleopsis nitida]|nr:hypothetical protein C8Q80DRAFT_559546 [Daedaleopsis nitida]